MKLAYQHAIINLSRDLTDPMAGSTPIAHLVIAQVEDGQHLAGIAVVTPEGLDPLTQAVLSDTQQLVKRHVDEAFRSAADAAPLGEILARVYHSLRNSVHMSQISELLSAEVTGDVVSTVIDILHRVSPEPPPFVWSPLVWAPPGGTGWVEAAR